LTYYDSGAMLNQTRCQPTGSSGINNQPKATGYKSTAEQCIHHKTARLS